MIIKDYFGGKYNLSQDYMASEPKRYRVTRNDLKQFFESRAEVYDMPGQSKYKWYRPWHSTSWISLKNTAANPAYRWFSIGCKGFRGEDLNKLEAWALAAE